MTTLGHVGCIVPRQDETDRLTDRHGEAHKMFFAHSRAWRKPIKLKVAHFHVLFTRPL